jgi:histidine ammonia-lyase
MTRLVACDGRSLTLSDLVAIADGLAEMTLTDDAVQRIDAARAVVDRHASGDKAVYGINTGFGALAETTIPRDALNTLQLNLLRSHAAGVGEPLPVRTVRASMALRANVLAKGFSGVRRQTVDDLLHLLNHRVHPVVPSRGSVGASGDLAPLAHLALVLVGEGFATVGDDPRVWPGSLALEIAGLRPVTLEAKEGLALINGTQPSTAVLALALVGGERLARAADIAVALSLDALRGSVHPFEARIHEPRPYAGQSLAAANVRLLLEHSAINKSHEFCGNFHGAPVAVAADLLAIAVAQFATISERRSDRLVNPVLSELPAFLTPNSGLQSGYMMAQVTAAALASEVKTLAHPASVDTIPTSANREDHVSMSMGAALKAERAVSLASRVLAVELLCACQALDLLAPLKTSPRLQRVHERIRSAVPALADDRPPAPDIEAIAAMIVEGALETACGGEVK